MEGLRQGYKSGGMRADGDGGGQCNLQRGIGLEYGKPCQ